MRTHLPGTHRVVEPADLAGEVEPQGDEIGQHVRVGGAAAGAQARVLGEDAGDGAGGRVVLLAEIAAEPIALLRQATIARKHTALRRRNRLNSDDRLRGTALGDACAGAAGSGAGVATGAGGWTGWGAGATGASFCDGGSGVTGAGGGVTGVGGATGRGFSGAGAAGAGGALNETSALDETSWKVPYWIGASGSSTGRGSRWTTTCSRQDRT
jgi:hypothetical protein